MKYHEITNVTEEEMQQNMKFQKYEISHKIKCHKKYEISQKMKGDYR